MPITRAAVKRHQIIDRCLRDRSNTYTLEQLTAEVSDYLVNELGDKKGISMSTIEKDIAFMRSDAGYMAPIEVEKVGKQSFYYYRDSKFSITNSPLDKEDAASLKSVLKLLEPFNHLPQFADLEEILVKLESKSISGKNRPTRATILFESNPLATGLHFIRLLHDHIIKRHSLDITYRPFDKPAMELRVSPLLLKEYSNRWFLFCNHHKDDKIINLALDRILIIERSADDFRDDPAFDPEEYFRNVIGVSVPEGKQKPVRVLLQFNREQSNYIRTKPLHSTQKIVEERPDGITIELTVIPNYELKKLIWSFGDTVEVLTPGII